MGPPELKETDMRRYRYVQKWVACAVAVAFCYLSVVVAPVQAALVGTADILATHQNEVERQKVVHFFERKDVVHYLHVMGVDKVEAEKRVNAMTPNEINLLAAKIDQVPAGGDAIGFIAAVAFIAFVTLIITDIIGVTDVFTFIKKR
jgi:hypothetical protein